MSVDSQKWESREGVAPDDIEVRECTTIEEFDACVRMQREAFGLPDLELSPRRHLIVSRAAGGWVLGAFNGDALVGFVLHLAAVRGSEVIGYSHMMAVAKTFQNAGIGARLKWAQRARAVAEGRGFIRWTWDPMQARNAHFNLNRLGVVVRRYAANLYGTDYTTIAGEYGKEFGLDSDRLVAEWELLSPRVERLARAGRQGQGSQQGSQTLERGQMPGQGQPSEPRVAPVVTVEIPPDWNALLRRDAAAARRELLRVRQEFEAAFAQRLVCAGFARDPAHPQYLFYRADSLDL